MLFRLLVLVFALFSVNSLVGQTQVYPFATTTEYNDWAPYSTMSPVSFSYNSPAQTVNYNVNTSDPLHLLSTQVVKTALPFQLENYFEVSFKAHKNLTSNQNTYFPLILTQNILTGLNQHPWRLGPNAMGTLGSQQSCGLIGVVFTHNQIGIVYRQNGLTNGAVTYISGYSVPVQTDFWVKLTMNCQSQLILEVFNVATMDNTPLASQIVNVTGPSEIYGAMYIANCNGNGAVTEHDDLLDDYTISMDQPSLSVSISGPTSFCSGETIQLTASESSNITWSTGQTSQTISVNAAGTYSVTYNAGCGAAVTDHVVTMNPSPEITNVEIQDVSCPGMQDGQFTVNTTGSNLEFSIDGGQNWQTSSTFTSLAGGDYSVIVQTSLGCTETVSVHIDEPTELTASVTANGPFCDGDVATLFGSSNGTGTLDYFWSGPNNYTSSLQNPNNITESGTYTLIVSNGACDATTNIDVTFGEIPVAMFTALSVCEGNETVFSSTGTGVGAPDAITDWYWTFGDGQIGHDENPLHMYASSGTFGVTLTVTSSNGCTASFTQSVEVLEAPIADFQFSPLTASVSDPEVTFTNTTQNGDNYLWIFDDLGNSSQELSPVYTYPEEEYAYVVTLIAYNKQGCTDTVQKIVIIGDGLIYYVPNSFTPNGDGVNELFVPVFTSGFDAASFQMEIYNRWGELIFQSNDATLGWNGKVDGLVVPDGTYTWIIRFRHLKDDGKEELSGHVVLLH